MTGKRLYIILIQSMIYILYEEAIDRFTLS